MFTKRTFLLIPILLTACSLTASPSWLMQGAKYAATALNFGIANYYVATSTKKNIQGLYLVEKTPLLKNLPDVSEPVKDFSKSVIDYYTDLKDKEEISYKIFNSDCPIGATGLFKNKAIVFSENYAQDIENIVTAKSIQVQDSDNKTKEIELTPELRRWYAQPYVFLLLHESEHFKNQDILKRTISLPLFAGITQSLCSALHSGVKKTPLIKYGPKNPISLVAINAGIGLTKLATTIGTQYTYIRHQETLADEGAIHYLKNVGQIDSIIQDMNTRIEQDNKSLASFLQLSEKDVVTLHKKAPKLNAFLYFLHDPEHPSWQTRKDSILKYRDELIKSQENHQ
jgi:hypothetical protein